MNRIKVSAAIVYLISLILTLGGAAYATRLYTMTSPAITAALTVVLYTVIFTTLVRVLPLPQDGGHKKQEPKSWTQQLKGWEKNTWLLAAILIVAALAQAQVYNFAVSRNGIAPVTAMMAMGAIAVSCWRLAFPTRRLPRPQDVLWPLVATVGLLLVTQPFTGGADVLGLVAAVGCAFTVGLFLVVGGRLAKVSALALTQVMMNCAAAGLSVLILVLTGTVGGEWIDREVILMAVIASGTGAVGGYLQNVAFRLSARQVDAPAEDVLSSVEALSPVVALPTGMFVEVPSQEAAEPIKWIGAIAMSVASIRTIVLLARRRQGADAAEER